ncbi:MAG: DUF342 domain-containing protein [Lachnospiraceae bacterium]|nr:DUF342 domain-containing protein [Lachnospiraceae bacterium]
MKYKNSFFKVNIKDDGTYITIYPAVSDGKKLEYKEVMDFLEKKGIVIEDKIGLKAQIEGMGSEILERKLCDIKIQPFNESAIVTVSPDKLVAYIRFYAPSTGGKEMDKREIMLELANEKVSYGISEKIIDVFLMARQYCLNIPVAKGDKPIPARDTVIEYFFNTSPMSKPKLLEDGSVDYHDLSIFTPVKAGDALAKLTPHDMGKAGTDVYGKAIPQNKPKIKKLKHGRNIKESEDGCTLYSEVSGNVSLTNGTIFVSDTFNVPADVDASTGDIEYDGNVMVAGTVKTGFSIKAGGDIQVNGVVEAANLTAKGNIMIKGGVQAMSKGLLKADGNIYAQFFESANVDAGGDIYAGSILHSNIKCGEKIVVSGRKGFIVGGDIACKSYIEVNSIGNRMETQTIIKVGVNPQLYDDMKVLIKSVNELNEKITEITSYLNVYKEKLKLGAKLSPENLKQIKSYNANLTELIAERNDKNEKLTVIRAEFNEGRRGKIKVLGNVYRGVVISIAGMNRVIQEKETHNLYLINNGELTTSSF